MSSTTEHRYHKSRRLLLLLAAVAAAIALILLAAAGILHSHGSVRVLLLLSAVGLAVGCALAALLVGGEPQQRVIARCGLVAIGLSQAAYHLLVWSGWKTQTPPWRFWWISMVASLYCTHMVLLQAARRPGKDPVNAAARWGASVAAPAIACLALRSDLLGGLHPLWAVLVWLPAGLSTVASLTVALRHLAAGRNLSPGRGWRLALLLTSHAAAVAVGLYIGSTSTEVRSGHAEMPSALAHLSPAEVQAQLTADLLRLQTVAAGLTELQTEMVGFSSAVRDLQRAEGRDYLLPVEDEQLRWHFVTYLSYRTALLRLVTTYSGFEAVRDPSQRAASFMLGYAAAATVYRSGLDLVHAYADHPLERRKLNEAEPAWGIPSGIFDRIYEDVSADRHVQLCEEMAAYFEHRKPQWRRQGVWPEHDFEWLQTHIEASLAAGRARGVDRHQRWFDLVIEKVRVDAYTPIYAVQSMVAEWIGDIRIIDRPRFVDPDTINQVAAELRPGDILLERRSFNASNAFLPGFWPHVALYVGRPADLVRLGIADAPEVAARWHEFTGATPDGHEYTVIEALGEGVIFNSLEHSLHADYAAVLRPRLSEEQVAEAIVRAFRHQGKPYDFEFDFFTSDKLVCTELVYRAYQDLLHFELQHVMGRDTLPALEMVHKYARERGTEVQELELVVFLDADATEGKVFRADEQAFIESAGRRREFNE